MDFNDIDLANIEPSRPFEALVPGWYKCVGIDASEKPTKDQCGSYLQIDWEVIEGDRKGARLISRLNLAPSPNGKNPAMTRQIAERDLSAISIGIGYIIPSRPNHSSELLNKPIMIKVAKQKDNPEYNEVKGYGPVVKGAQAALTSNTTTAKKPKPWAVNKVNTQDVDDEIPF